MRSNSHPTDIVPSRERSLWAIVWVSLCAAMTCLAWPYMPDARAALTIEKVPPPSIAGETHGISEQSPSMREDFTEVIRENFPRPGNTQFDRVELTKPATVMEVGRWPGGSVHAVALDASRNLAFVGLDHAIGILNTSGGPNLNPTLASVLTTTDSFYHLFYANHLLYAAAFSKRLQIIDVSDPTHPVETGSLDTSTPVFDLFVAGNFVYLAGGACWFEDY